MIFNPASRIIVHLLFYRPGVSVKSVIDPDQAVLSPIMKCSKTPGITKHHLALNAANETAYVSFITQNFTSEEELELEKILKYSSENLKKFINIFLKKGMTINYIKNESPSVDIPALKQLDMHFAAGGDERSLKILLPSKFFRLFSSNIDTNSDPEKIEDEIIRFFMNPKWMFPDIKLLLSNLEKTELNMLINQLQKHNLISPYQLFLLTEAFPEHSLRIKSAVSKNTISEIMKFKKDSSKLKITGRDVKGGVYSVEESIFNLFNLPVDLNHSALLKNIQRTIIDAGNMVIILSKSFNQWIEQIERDKLLYNTISVTEESRIAAMISGEPEKYLEKFARYISGAKISIIRSLTGKSQFSEIIAAQTSFILNYRKLKIRRTKSDHERFDYLISFFNRESDYNSLLMKVGWYTLSTALKGATGKTRLKILKNINPRAASLIEDILKGTLNPGIIHDEIQINKAKKTCVNAIMVLYEDGIIDLDEY